MSVQAALTFLQGVGKALAFWQKAKKADSLLSFTQTTRVEPICIVDQRVLHLSYTSDIMQALNAIFAATYLQAASLVVNVGKINVGKILGQLNPDRPYLESRNPAMECFFDPPLLPSQDYRYGLPLATTRPALESLPAGTRHALEALGDEIREEIEPYTDALKQGLHDKAAELAQSDQVLKSDPNTRAGFGGDLSKDMRESANLSVGRMYTVEITDGGHSASIPVLIRLLATECAPDLLVHILSDGAHTQTSTGKERWFGYKLGDLKFWRDLVFASDLIDEHKKALLKDDNGVYAEILRRRRGNVASSGLGAVLSGGTSYKPSVGTASNLIVTTRQSIKDLEAKIGGKFDHFDTRQKVFEQTYLMVVVVVDPDYDHVSFYYRGIALPSEFTVRDLKKVGKDGGDMIEALKALSMGTAPRF